MDHPAWGLLKTEEDWEVWSINHRAQSLSPASPGTCLGGNLSVGLLPLTGWKTSDAWETRGRRDGCYPQDRNRRQSSFPFHWRELYRKLTNTKAKTSSGPFPAICLLTYRNGTSWCRQEKTRSKQSSLISVQTFRSFEFLRWQNHLFLAFEPVLDWTKTFKGKSVRRLLGTCYICHSGTVHITCLAKNVSLLVKQMLISLDTWD